MRHRARVGGMHARRGDATRRDGQACTRHRRARHAGRLHGRPGGSDVRRGDVTMSRARQRSREGTVVHDVVGRVARKHEATRTEHPVVGRAPPERHADATPPDEQWRSRRPTDVCVLVGRDSPDDPCGGVLITRNPRPPVVARPNPAAVVEDDVSERIVAHPHPVAARVESPMAGRHVRRETIADDGVIRHPNEAVLRIFDPLTIGIELRPEVRERARIVVRHLSGRRRAGGSRPARRVDRLGVRSGWRRGARRGCGRRTSGRRRRRARSWSGTRSTRGSRTRFAARRCADRDRVLRRVAGLDAVRRTVLRRGRAGSRREADDRNERTCPASHFTEPSRAGHGGIMGPRGAPGNQPMHGATSFSKTIERPRKECEFRIRIRRCVAHEIGSQLGL